MRLLTPTDVRDLARRYGIQPTKALGQNLLLDPNTTRRIVRLAQVTPEDAVLEVGAGLGTLTLALADRARRVIAIEVDRAVLGALREVVSGLENVEVVEGNAMTLDYSSILADERHRLISNLPYNIATPLLMTLIEEVPQIGDFFVMVQEEVGERLVAAPGSKTYGAVSVMVALCCEAERMGRVPPTVFWPAPKVESMLVRLDRRQSPLDIAPGDLMPVVRAAFSQRRKTVRNAL
ncbi:MAG: 16S rRNA (adenine(1518)-N(6)/adenine(1519)-N(6))-dimethyltransferase RsmA, partial [Candidatus Methylomirabilales bacterium]